MYIIVLLYRQISIEYQVYMSYKNELERLKSNLTLFHLKAVDPMFFREIMMAMRDDSYNNCRQGSLIFELRAQELVENYQTDEKIPNDKVLTNTVQLYLNRVNKT